MPLASISLENIREPFCTISKRKGIEFLMFSGGYKERPVTWNGAMDEKVTQKEKNGPRFSSSEITL